jgi:folylpolyglutamate synthase/dihydropteroate synthase
VDVAHNPAGAVFLQELLAYRYPDARFAVILSMLADKDASGVPLAFADNEVPCWIATVSRGPRGRSAASLAQQLGVENLGVAETPAGALDAALEQVRSGVADAVLGFGSFSLVEDLRNELLLRGAVAQPDAEPDPRDHDQAPAERRI